MAYVVLFHIGQGGCWCNCARLYQFQLLTFEEKGAGEFESNEQLFERINKLYRDALKSLLVLPIT